MFLPEGIERHESHPGFRIDRDDPQGPVREHATNRASSNQICTKLSSEWMPC